VQLLFVLGPLTGSLNKLAPKPEPNLSLANTGRSSLCIHMSRLHRQPAVSCPTDGPLAGAFDWKLLNIEHIFICNGWAGGSGHWQMASRFVRQFLLLEAR